MLLKTLLALVFSLVFLQGWFRLAPSDPARWHKQPEARPGKGENWVVEVWPGGGAQLMRLDGVIRATPRTRVLAGSAEDGLVTYVTRSAFWGFPDYTTLALGPEGITLWARSRFGRSDLGVNAARLAGWKERLETVERGQ